jgi:hypothetical protein
MHLHLREVIAREPVWMGTFRWIGSIGIAKLGPEFEANALAMERHHTMPPMLP